MPRDDVFEQVTDLFRFGSLVESCNHLCPSLGSFDQTCVGAETRVLSSVSPKKRPGRV
jgi:hypothetical protein